MRLTIVIITLITLAGCSTPPPEPISQPLEERYIVRGRELVLGLGACGYCHGLQPSPSSPLAGGRLLADDYGEIAAPNLTSARSGLRSWSADAVLAALRVGAPADPEIFSPDAHRGFDWISDEDALSIVAYIKLLDPVEHEVERRSDSSAERSTTAFWIEHKNPIGYVPEISSRFSVAYGRYLTEHVARCGSCHNSPESMLDEEGFLEGGKTVRSDKGETLAPSLTGSVKGGLGSWSEDDIVHYLRTGITVNRKQVHPSYCPTNFYRNGSETDLYAIARFLKSLAAK